jgi:ATP-dependent Clp protease ATP-binding subunit ClpC
MTSFWNSLESDRPFTDRTQQILLLAADEAILANRGYIGPEHILLAIMRGPVGVAAFALRDHGVELVTIRKRINEIRPEADEHLCGQLATHLAETSVKQAIEEAAKLGCDYVGTEHLLLSLLQEKETVAGQILFGFGLEYENIRDELWQHLKGCWHIYSPPP